MALLLFVCFHKRGQHGSGKIVGIKKEYKEANSGLAAVTLAAHIAEGRLLWMVRDALQPAPCVFSGPKLSSSFRFLLPKEKNSYWDTG